MTKVACVGLAALDHIFDVDAFPTGSGKNFATGFRTTVGGPAANAAIAATRLGAGVQLVAPVGDDESGRRIRTLLDAQGVDTTCMSTAEGAASSVSAVAVDSSGERMIINHTGEALAAAPAYVVGKVIKESDAVLADLRWFGGADSTVAAAEHAGVPSILDFDANTAGDVTELVERANHVVFSAAGLELFTGTSDPAGGLEKAAAIAGQGVVAVTLGGDGVMWIENGEAAMIPAFAVDVVDTLGAGDVFHGAYALAIAEGRPVAEAIRRSAAAAALKCTRHGVAGASPTADELEEFLGAH